MLCLFCFFQSLWMRRSSSLIFLRACFQFSWIRLLRLSLHADAVRNLLRSLDQPVASTMSMLVLLAIAVPNILASPRIQCLDEESSSAITILLHISWDELQLGNETSFAQEIFVQNRLLRRRRKRRRVPKDQCLRPRTRCRVLLCVHIRWGTYPTGSDKSCRHRQSIVDRTALLEVAIHFR